MDIYHHLYGYLPPPPPPPLPQPTPGDRKVNGFQLKTLDKVSILYPGSLGTVSGGFGSPRGEKIVYNRTMICVRFVENSWASDCKHS